MLRTYIKKVLREEEQTKRFNAACSYFSNKYSSGDGKPSSFWSAWSKEDAFWAVIELAKIDQEKGKRRARA